MACQNMSVHTCSRPLISMLLVTWMLDMDMELTTRAQIGVDLKFKEVRVHNGWLLLGLRSKFL